MIPDDGGLELAVPIRIGDRLAGVLDIVASEARPLDEEDVLAARTLADQLAIAIENSRLYEQASELAANQERQRLARDLHDAVSQTLFSVSLIAEVLPRIYARDPEQGAAAAGGVAPAHPGRPGRDAHPAPRAAPGRSGRGQPARSAEAAGRGGHRPGPHPGGGGHRGLRSAAHRRPGRLLPHRPGGPQQRGQALRRRQGQGLAGCRCPSDPEAPASPSRTTAPVSTRPAAGAASWAWASCGSGRRRSEPTCSSAPRPGKGPR